MPPRQAGRPAGFITSTLLQRTPRGYNSEHPLVADLKRQSFITTTSFTEKEAGAPDFLDRFAQACRRATPLMRFLTVAVGLPWQ